MRLKGIKEDPFDGIDLHEARARTLAGLKWICEQNGFKPGWSSVKFKTIFGSWPNGESGVEPAAPMLSLVEWVKRENAAYCKIMRAKEAAAAPKVEPEKESALMTGEDWNVAL